MANKNRVREKVVEILESRRSAPEEASPDFEAMLALYDVHDYIWHAAITGCMKEVRNLLDEQLPEWKAEQFFENDQSYFDLRLWKQAGWTTRADGTPNLYVVLATEDWAPGKEHGGPTYLVVYVLRARGFWPEGANFNKRDQMRIGKGKDQYVARLQLGDVDLRSQAGVRYFLDSQSSVDIAGEVVGFISRIETSMDACFRASSGGETKPRHS